MTITIEVREDGELIGSYVAMPHISRNTGSLGFHAQIPKCVLAGEEHNGSISLTQLHTQDAKRAEQATVAYVARQKAQLAQVRAKSKGA